MLGAERERFFKLACPRLGCVIGACIDEIEAAAREDMLRELDRVLRFVDAVQTAERLERGTIERLHADRNAIDAGCAIIAKALLLHTVGIGFERDLDIVCGRPQLCDAIEHAANRSAAHQGRRTAAEEHARNTWPLALQPGDEVELAQDRIAPAGFAERVADMRVEVAIRTLRRAIGPVNVDAEPAHGLRSAAFTNFSNAFARCEMACLALGSISANVNRFPSGMKIGS